MAGKDLRVATGGVSGGDSPRNPRRPIFVREEIGGWSDVSMDVDALVAASPEQYWSEWDAEVDRQVAEWDRELPGPVTELAGFE